MFFIFSRTMDASSGVIVRITCREASMMMMVVRMNHN